MIRYKNKLPSRPVHAERTPFTVMSELLQLQMQFASHHLENLNLFLKDSIDALADLRVPRPEEVQQYVADAAQRQILLLDTMRERGNRYLEHEAAGNPPVLVFEYETVLDAQDFTPPCNYELVRILPKEGHTIDPEKRPFVIFDPRAGHGPGIGGFKADSQVGNALSAGHPVYFVIFRMHPVPGQTLRDVADAEARFLTWIREHHPNAPAPCVMGNCQGGWMIMAVAASHPGLTGPLILSGAPLSYWGGVTGKNPMRYTGGLMGGSWLAYLMSDLGGGEFDGANLVVNFESLNPANTFWEKYYNLYTHIDTERERFLDFERWWGGYIFMTTEEMRAILDNLFIGNKLSHGKIVTRDAVNLDLRSIRQPIIVFCSEGDNITPPQQALNWIADLYTDERAIKLAGQVIVYLVHRTTGHLGIFVSSAIIKREQMQIANMLEQIETLPPGLYEMIITDEGDPQKPTFNVRLEERTIQDLLKEGGHAQQDEAEFHLVNVISNMNAEAYRNFIRPWAQWTSYFLPIRAIRQLHPMRMQHWMLSDLNPFLLPVRAFANMVRANRVPPVESDNPLFHAEQNFSRNVQFAFNTLRDTRDIASEELFYAVYGMLAASPWGQEITKIDTSTYHEGRIANEEQLQNILEHASEGDFVDGVMRIFLLLIQARGFLGRGDIDELRLKVGAQADFAHLKRREQRERLNRQAVIVAYRPDVAVKTLVKLLPDAKAREKALELVAASSHWFDNAGSGSVDQAWKRIHKALGISGAEASGAQPRATSKPRITGHDQSSSLH